MLLVGRECWRLDSSHPNFAHHVSRPSCSGGYRARGVFQTASPTSLSQIDSLARRCFEIVVPELYAFLLHLFYLDCVSELVLLRDVVEQLAYLLAHGWSIVSVSLVRQSYLAEPRVDRRRLYSRLWIERCVVLLPKPIHRPILRRRTCERASWPFHSSAVQLAGDCEGTSSYSRN